MGSPLMSRNRVAEGRKGLQPCNLVIGARDDSIAGDPCYRSLRVRGFAADSSPRAPRQDHRRRADRARGGPGVDGDALRSPVPGHGRQPACGLVCAPARPIAIQPSPAAARSLHRHGPARGGRADRLGADAARRRDVDLLRQLRRLRLEEPLRRPRRVRLLPVEEPVRVGHAARPGHRRERGPGWL